MTKRQRVEQPASESSEGEDIDFADQVLLPDLPAVLRSESGHRYELEESQARERLTVRAPGGTVLLRATVTARGLELEFAGADIDIAATRTLRLRGKDVEIAADRRMDVSVKGDQHTRVDGAARVEAGEVELQANERHLSMRAAGRIALDGSHVALNDDPAPRPFGWSAIADDPEG